MDASADKITTVAIADDHALIRSALVNFITTNNNNYRICVEASNGKDLLEQLEQVGLTDIILLDINMPVMNGFETMTLLKKKYKDPVVIALTAYNDYSMIQRMVASGIKGCLLKLQASEDLLVALDTVARNEKYFSEQVREILHSAPDKALYQKIASLKEKEITFLKYLCGGMTYKEIAAKMCLSPYTVQDYRDALFAKLELNRKADLILFALKHKLVEQA